MLFNPAAIKSSVIYLIFIVGLSLVLLDTASGAFGNITAWLFSANIVLFTVMAKDKFAAIFNFRRTPEGTLLWLAFAGAYPALFLARFIFNHKTTKPEFQKPMWFLLFAQIMILIYYSVMVEGF
jgi:uncharacterized membrane protein YsdA (DUF1294 family)